MTPVHDMSVGDLAELMAKVTNLSPSYHARQLRAQIREAALVSPVRGGRGLTAPVLFDDAGLARAMVLHVLAKMGLEMPLLRQAAACSANVDSETRKVNVAEPSDGIELAIARLRSDPEAKVYLHLSLKEDEEGNLVLGGYVASTSTPSENVILPPLAMMVLPLHAILKPVLRIA